MENYIRKNIDFAQTLAKKKISAYLKESGYKLMKDEHYTKGIETRLFSWSNENEIHGFQLIWDGKEQWFDLSELSSNSSSVKHIKLIPFKVTKWIFRKSYLDKIVESIINEIKMKIQ